MGTLGRNVYFPIYIDVNGEQTPFENLVLKKSTVTSALMSLSDNITGDVYYKNNNLDVSMQEYIIYNDVKYVLVNPPTIVREGMVSDNSETKGMTKYSFTFYHPMYQLSNMPFTDVAVINTDERYKSVDKTFSWVGNLEDYVDKLNKNLENTLWVVILGERVPQGVVDTLSDVLSFDNNTIANALETMYDTWETPFIIDSIREGEPYYNAGKRFSVLVGLPSNEIYASEDDRIYERPFVFRFGKGVGLKNNSATPRNNKIVTRIAGYGSENNIPFGYPQIPWTGDQSWDYTRDNDPTNYNSYPIYKGIYGGQWVKLIKHPFTRSHLMPSIYVDTVNKKVNPYAEDYDPTIELVDYYDADDPSVYPNVIVPNAPSYEIHQFEKIKPELGEEHIISATPLNNDLTPASSWVDDIDDDGNYVQSYFKIKIPQLAFDLYACAAITEEMQINMRSGACIGATFTVQIDWDDYKANFYDSDGNFDPDGTRRDLTKYPKSNQGQIELVLQKENQTFGVIMPNIYQYPKGETSQGAGNGDQFVILGISLPISYVTSAEERLDEAMASYMLENNIHYFDYPLKFDEKFLFDNVNILSQIRNNTVIRFQFANTQLELFVKQISIKYGQGVLPQYDITLTDDVNVVLNQIGQAQKDIGKINSLISALQQTYNRNVWAELDKKLSKVSNDVAHGIITFDNGLRSFGDALFGQWMKDVAGAGIYRDDNGNWHIEGDFLHARKKLVAKELQIEEITHVGGQQLLTAAEMTCDLVVEHETFWRCYFLKTDGDGKVIHNKFKVGDQAIMMSFNVDEWDEDTTGNRYYWRLVVGVGNNDEGYENYNYIDLSKSDCDTDSDAPLAEDKIVQLGYRYDDDSSRQNAIMLAGAGESSPYIDEYVGINSYSLEGKVQTRIKPNENLFTGKMQINPDSTYNGVSLAAIFGGYNANLDEIMSQLQAYGNQIDDISNGLSDVEDDLGNIESSIEGLENPTTGNENLLRNTGFTGDYETASMTEDVGVRDDTQVYSDPLKYWTYENTTIEVNVNSASGFSANINNGTLTQAPTKELELGEWYNVSFRAKGLDMALEIGGYSTHIVLSNNLKRYTYKFVVTNPNEIFSIKYATCTIMEIQLSAGSVPNVDWIPSPLDNSKAIAYYQDLVYLANAMANASTSILGGLILTNMIRVGNYRDRQMIQETGGMSGTYNSGNSPFLWGGGTMEQAFYTIGKYAQDPSYQATPQEISQMAKFVVTHGGRAILNDIVLRGYIHALGGYFKGEVHADSGIFKNILSPNGKFKIDDSGYFECEDAKIKGYLYTPLLVINEDNWMHYLGQADPDTGARMVNIGLSGLNIQFDYLGWGSTTSTLNLPLDDQSLLGAQVHILNNSSGSINIHYAYVEIGGAYVLYSGKLAVFYCYYNGSHYQWAVAN
jgi:hypothetical protein